MMRPIRFSCRGQSGFSLLEVVVSAGILSLFTAGTYATLLQMNRQAMVAKLRTAAFALAQQKLDGAMTAPWQVGDALPAPLASGIENGLSLNDDPVAIKSGISSAFTKLDLPVPAKRTTRTSVVNGVSPHAQLITVTVAYTYCNVDYQVEVSSIRTTDNT